MATWYLVELWIHVPGGGTALIESWNPRQAGSWSDFHVSLPPNAGDYVYELRVTDGGNAGVSNTQMVAMSFKR